MLFSDFAHINPKTDLQKGNVYPFIEMGDVTPGNRYVIACKNKKFKSGGSRFQSNDIIFARITPCLENGKIAQVKGNDKKKYFGSTEFFVFKAKDGISDEGFLFYLSYSDIIRKPAEKSMYGASGRQRADLGVIKSIEIPEIPFKNQKKIASILSVYDDLIENNIRRIKILEEMAQLIYREWFVNFRFLGYEKVRFVDLELSGIPEGWEVRKVGDILEKVKRKKKVKKQNYKPDGSIPVVDQGRDFIGGYTTDIKNLYSNPLPIIVFGDHTRALKYVDFPFACGADGTQLLKANTERMPISLFYYVLKSIDLSDFAYSRHFKFLKEKKVLVPDEQTARFFERVVNPMRDQIKYLLNRNNNLRRTRDLLLPKLISGELGVSDLDIAIQEQEA